MENVLSCILSDREVICQYVNLTLLFIVVVGCCRFVAQVVVFDVNIKKKINVRHEICGVVPIGIGYTL